MKSIGPVAIALLSAVQFACSGSGAGASSGDADPAVTVQAALTAPTGTLSPATAKALLVNWQAFQRVHAAFDAILSIGTATAAPCLDGSPNGGTYDLACITLGQAHGRLAFQSRGSSTDAGLVGRVDVELDQACVDDACVNAEGSADITPPGDCTSLATVALTATVSRAGQSQSFFFGAEGGMGRAELLPHVVYFQANDGSFVIDGEGGLTVAGPYLVSDASRSLECLFFSDGGQCSGDASFAF